MQQAYRAAFTLTVENTSDNRNNLYLDTSNTLTLTASSDGALVMADQDACFLLDFGLRFPPAAWDGEPPSATGLTATLMSPARPTHWRFTPNSTPWTVPDKLIITMPGITPTKGNGLKTVSLTFSWKGLKGADDDGRIVRLDIVPPPDPALQELALKVEWWDLSSSGTGSDIQPVNLSTREFPPISNTIAFVIMNPSESLPVVGTPGGHPEFWFTFNTVESEGDSGAVDALCTLEKATLIRAKAMVGDSDWSAAQKPDHNLNWQLFPPTNVLGRGESIIIEIANIISYLPAYATALYLNWSDVPGYNDGGQTLIIKKQPAPPTIASFTYAGPDPAGITIGQQVTLSWKTYGERTAGPVTIFDQDNPDNQIVSSGNAIGSVTVSPLIPVTYVLEIEDVPTWPLPIDVERVAVSNLSVTPAKSLYNIGDSVTLNATISFASSYEVDPGVLASTDLFGSTTIAVPVTVTRGTYTLTAIGYGAPAVGVWTLPISGSALPGTLYMAIGDGIYSLDPQLTTTRIAEISPELVTDTCVFNGQIYWGRSDIAAIFYANLDGTAAASTSTSASVLSITLSDQWVASQAAAVCGDGRVYIMPLRNPPWMRTLFQLSPVDATTKIRTMASHCLMSTSTGIYDWSIDFGQTSPVTVDIPAVSTALVVPPGNFLDDPSADSSDQQTWGYYNDTTSAAIFGLYPNADNPIVKICSAQLSANSNLVICGSDDLYWFEDAVGGGRSLWHCNIPTNTRTQVWWTEKLPCTLTTDVSNF